MSTTARFDRAFFALLADWLAVGVAVALPWSTGVTAIFIALWLVVVLATLDPVAFKREPITAAGGLAVLLWCLGAAGMLWADVGWTARVGGLGGFNRLLVIPMLLTQFRRSEHGGWVICGFFISSALVLTLSYVLILTPGLTWRGNYDGVPMHDYIFQGSDFLICGFGALGCAWNTGFRRHSAASVVLTAVGVLFLANFAFVVFSRIALVVAPILAALLGWRLSRWKGILGACLVGAIIGAAFWFGSTTVRTRLHDSMKEIQQYRATDAATSIGMHTAFLKESLAIIASAPIIGHGTGSIPEEFRQVTAGQSGAAAVATVNPHNQTFAVAIQLGLVGTLVLWSMWLAHFLWFRGGSLAAWLGTVVVVENIVSSTVHSHLFDFSNGWLYVFGVGVLGGTTWRERCAPPAKTAPLS